MQTVALFIQVRQNKKQGTYSTDDDDDDDDAKDSRETHQGMGHKQVSIAGKYTTKLY